MAKEIVAMILAGGRGSRLYALTQKQHYSNPPKEDLPLCLIAMTL